MLTHIPSLSATLFANPVSNYPLSVENRHASAARPESHCSRTTSYVFTIELVAKRLGVDEDLIADIASTDMDPEHGCLWIHGIDQEVLGFTKEGVEHVQELIQDRNTLTD